MATFTMTHELDCDEERFWKLFWDRDFNAKMFAHLEFPRWELAELRDTDTEIVRIVKATPKLDMPAAVAKVLGPGFGYTEEGRFDKASKTFRFVVKPNTLEGKLRNEGTVRTEPLEGGRTRRVVDVVAEAKVFGVGGMLETMTEKNFRAGWAKGAAFINDWLKTHP